MDCRDFNHSRFRLALIFPLGVPANVMTTDCLRSGVDVRRLAILGIGAAATHRFHGLLLPVLFCMA